MSVGDEWKGEEGQKSIETRRKKSTRNLEIRRSLRKVVQNSYFEVRGKPKGGGRLYKRFCRLANNLGLFFPFQEMNKYCRVLSSQFVYVEMALCNHVKGKLFKSMCR